LRVGVIQFPRISNFTDFDALAAEPSVALAFVRRPSDVAQADVLILPGSKQTLDDLAWLRRTGLAAAVCEHARRRPVIGICGGMQMLGLEVHDPHAVEGGGRRKGLGLLGIRTVLGREKVTRRATATLRATSLFSRPCARRSLAGYEIHLGTTRYESGTRPLLQLRREGDLDLCDDGARSPDERVIGTYLHGFFDTDDFRHALVKTLRAAAGLSAARTLSDFSAQREARLNRWADHVRLALDVRRIEDWLR
jgi:adenosylcobyric acid synthase